MTAVSKAKYDKKGRKLCTICGKPEGEVLFSEAKNECNKCRAAKVAEYENTPERLVQLWKPRNEQKMKIFLKGKADPCTGCVFGSCSCCVVFHAKMKYMDPSAKETQLFVREFTKNLLENLRKVAKVG